MGRIIREYTYPIVHESRHRVMPNDGDTFGYARDVDAECDMIERELVERALVNHVAAKPHRRIRGTFTL